MEHLSSEAKTNRSGFLPPSLRRAGGPPPPPPPPSRHPFGLFVRLRILGREGEEGGEGSLNRRGGNGKEKKQKARGRKKSGLRKRGVRLFLFRISPYLIVYHFSTWLLLPAHFGEEIGSYLEKRKEDRMKQTLYLPRKLRI